MALLQQVRFISQEKSTFYSTLYSRVDAYFKENQLSKNATFSVVAKTLILLSAYLLPLVYIVVFQPDWGSALALWALMGVAMAGVGMNIMHDAIHGAYATHPVVNQILGYSLNLLGGSIDNWRWQHNHLHHTFTNIVHYDDDIADKPGLRLSPHTQLKPIHRFQWLHALVIYSLVTLYWVTAKDFLQFFRYKKNGINTNTTAQNYWLMGRMILLKIAYFFAFVALPIMVGIPFWEVASGFLLMHMIGGIILTVIFQLAHTVEGTSFPRPNAQGVVENDWAIHQMNTTVDFCRKNRLLSWYIGGLNFQVEHHLFPKICHIHYPKISEIVERTAAEFSVPYLQHRSFSDAVRSHFSTLQRFGQLPHLDDLMG